ncbi:palmitoyl-CoA hydrolase [Endozoicomonas montiporae]|uniref:Acyl-CoA thioesterase 2 n=2 Tax=Endozoicomonas montiporae TaxID=1027273 RepID=A0A081N914_9GAMM|nr:acyl-CoA thioesterase II [Endozoicomonas montiporae]AMO55132.1 acyl-CoA thioesterase II [Endozoicomonas montiporae CL-33]KEQ14937.1 palmitoyl-CoA hydrolase [Endozoicomonas montiporae]
MSKVLDELLELLKLEAIEENIFRGQSQDYGLGRVYGGQVIGQALSAARQTVPTERHVHSFHSYFLREGDVNLPIVYNVDCIRDGKSFTTRRVVAIQKGKPIFNLSASFHIEEEGFEHQDDMPASQDPEGLISDQALKNQMKDFLPPSVRERLQSESPIDIRYEEPTNPYRPEKCPPLNKVWFKAAGTMPDVPGVHKYLLAFASDMPFLPTALFPHGVRFLQPNLQVASLDHAMWFHRPFRMDEWLLYSIDSPSASGARGLVRGQVFDQQGRLVASTMQEGLIRQR